METVIKILIFLIFVSGGFIVVSFHFLDRSSPNVSSVTSSDKIMFKKRSENKDEDFERKYREYRKKTKLELKDFKDDQENEKIGSDESINPLWSFKYSNSSSASEADVKMAIKLAERFSQQELTNKKDYWHQLYLRSLNTTRSSNTKALQNYRIYKLALNIKENE